MPSSRIDSLLRSAIELSEPIHAHGAPPAARALIVARLAESCHRPIVVLCATDDVAATFMDDIDSLSKALRIPSAPILFPAWEQSPYSSIAPSIKTRLERIRALGLIRNSNSPLIIASMASAFQTTMPKEIFQKSSITLKQDADIGSRENLNLSLLTAGYLRTDTVEDPGSFAVRGEILDIFPSDRERPVRVELFDTLVEKIREFDPSTQRADPERTLREVWIPPAREVLIYPENTSLIRERLKSRADDLDIPRTIRDPILASLQPGAYPDHSDTWASFAYQKPGKLWEYLPDNTWIIWNDELSCQQEWDRHIEDQRRLAKESIGSNLIPPAVEGICDRNPETERHVRSLVKVFLDQVEIGVQAEKVDVPEQQEESRTSSKHRFMVNGNTDLARGSRHSLGELEPKLQLWMKQGFKVLALASTESQSERIRFLIEGRGFVCTRNAELIPGVVAVHEGSLSDGFRWPAEGLVVLTESEILGSSHVRRQRSSRQTGTSAAREWAGLRNFSDLSVGDAVVHADHGIGRYQGLARLKLSGAPSDFLLLEYANRDRLYIPVYRLNVIQKYVGAGESVTLDRLGSQQFTKTKEKVRDAVKKLAVDLVQLYAERKVRPGIRFSPRDSFFREFEAKFPYDETPDQIKAIDDVLSDMESGKVMDRLVCGDVGYGKTEVAIRAAFRAVSDGKQVAVLVPTTVLAFQHEQSFKQRLKDCPLSIESISRFKSIKDQKKVLESVAAGKVDIVIGTHRLFSRDVHFHDLGLIIVDEEHRFGVEHKEKLKSLKVNAHVLTLTATPIPRTLHMALSGLRDISLINTPPVDRLPIRTYVSKFDESLVKRAIEFELARGGQAFALHNRVQSIYAFATKIRELVPQAQIEVAHGQMGEGELENTMLRFYQKQFNILVCTSIIESGLDLPSANTILVDRADSLGLAQLYQLRGRVGRSQQRGYAYLFIPAETAITEDAKRRLEVIQKFVELGSGFNIANHDLEIRGGGDLLGPQQSGHINAVGFDLYTGLLEEAIHELEGTPASAEQSRREPEIKCPFPAYLSEEYVPGVHQRLSLYRRFSAAQREEDLVQLEEEIKDRFGAPPQEAQNLIWLIRTKQALKFAGIDALTVGQEKISLNPGPDSRLDPAQTIALVAAHPSKYQLTPDSKLVVTIPTSHLRDLYFALEKLLGDLCPKNEPLRAR